MSTTIRQLRQQVGEGVVALVNGSPIYLRQLDEECIGRHGTRRAARPDRPADAGTGLQAEPGDRFGAEIDAEIARAAAQLTSRLPDGSPDVKGWLALASKQQGVSVETYRREVVWPSVALKKLAVGRIEVTDEDLKKGFEANYGPRVRCRAIVLNNLRRAQEVWEMARRKPTVENFGELAAKYSIEGSSRALKGEVPPIRRYGGQPLLEEEAFALKPGDLSGVIQLDDKYVILFCEGYTKPIDVDFAERKEGHRRRHSREEGTPGHDRILRAFAGLGHGRQLPRPGGQPFAPQGRRVPEGGRPGGAGRLRAAPAEVNRFPARSQGPLTMPAKAALPPSRPRLAQRPWPAGRAGSSPWRP